MIALGVAFGSGKDFRQSSKVCVLRTPDKVSKTELPSQDNLDI
jgi:hypothetical protein